MLTVLPYEHAKLYGKETAEAMRQVWIA